MLAKRMWLVVPALAVLVGCAPSISGESAPSNVGPGSLGTCEEAFRRWVTGAAAYNSPGVDLLDNMRDQESIERRVFELCSLEEAERLNEHMQLEVAQGVTEPMIEPDFRTFASVECVDEAPLFDGTRLCAEVGH